MPLGDRSCCRAVATVAYLGLEPGVKCISNIVRHPGFPQLRPPKSGSPNSTSASGGLPPSALRWPRRITVNLSPPIARRAHITISDRLGCWPARRGGCRELVAYGGSASSASRPLAVSPDFLLAAIHASANYNGLICPAAQGSERLGRELNVPPRPTCWRCSPLSGSALLPPALAESTVVHGPYLAR